MIQSRYTLLSLKETNVPGSPLTGKPMHIRYELTYKGKMIQVPWICYVCEDTLESYTTTELDTINMGSVKQLYNSTL